MRGMFSCWCRYSQKRPSRSPQPEMMSFLELHLSARALMMELPATMTSARSLERPGMRRRIPGGVERSPLYQIAKSAISNWKLWSLAVKYLIRFSSTFPMERAVPPTPTRGSPQPVSQGVFFICSAMSFCMVFMSSRPRIEPCRLCFVRLTQPMGRLTESMSFRFRTRMTSVEPPPRSKITASSTLMVLTTPT